MIKYIQGDIFGSFCEALVNPVNCLGVMGAGLAKQFKQRYPKMFEEYKGVCYRKELTPGHLHVWWGDLDQEQPQQVIINLATKNDWRFPSQLGWVQEGLWTLRETLEASHIRSVAIPPLGCGLGGLRWEDVRSAIENEFADSDISVEVYEPN